MLEIERQFAQQPYQKIIQPGFLQEVDAELTRVEACSSWSIALQRIGEYGETVNEVHLIPQFTLTYECDGVEIMVRDRQLPGPLFVLRRQQKIEELPSDEVENPDDNVEDLSDQNLSDTVEVDTELDEVLDLPEVETNELEEIETAADKEIKEDIRPPLKVDVQWWQWNLALKNSESWKKRNSWRRSDQEDERLTTDFPIRMVCEITYDSEEECWVVNHAGKNLTQKDEDLPIWIEDVLTELESSTLSIDELEEKLFEDEFEWEKLTNTLVEQYLEGLHNFLVTFPDGSTRYVFASTQGDSNVTEVIKSSILQLGPSSTEENIFDGLEVVVDSPADSLIIRKDEFVIVIEAVTREEIVARQARIVDLFDDEDEFESYVMNLLQRKLSKGKIENFEQLDVAVQALKKQYSGQALRSLDTYEELSRLWDIPVFPLSEKEGLTDEGCGDFEDFFRKETKKFLKKLIGENFTKVMWTQFARKLSESEQAKVLTTFKLNKEIHIGWFTLNRAQKHQQQATLLEEQTKVKDKTQVVLATLAKVFEEASGFSDLKMLLRYLKNPQIEITEAERNEVLERIAKDELVVEARTAHYQKSSKYFSTPIFTKDEIAKQVTKIKERSNYQEFLGSKIDPKVREELIEEIENLIEEFDTALNEAMPDQGEREKYKLIAVEVMTDRLTVIEAEKKKNVRTLWHRTGRL